MKATGTLFVTLILSINGSLFAAATPYTSPNKISAGRAMSAQPISMTLLQLREALAARAREYTATQVHQRPSILKKRRKPLITPSLSILSSQIESTPKESDPLRLDSLTLTTDNQLGLMLRLAKVFIFGFTERLYLVFPFAVDKKTVAAFIQSSIYPIVKNYYDKTPWKKNHRVIINYYIENEIEELATSLENLDLQSSDFDNFDITPFSDIFGELSLADDSFTASSGYQSEEVFDFGL